MRVDDGLMPSGAGDGARRAAVARVFERLKRCQRSAPVGAALPDDPERVAREVSDDEDLPARFTRAATKVGMTVHAATPADWLDLTAGLLHKHNARLVAVPTAYDGFLDARRVQGLKQRLAADGLTAASDTDDDLLFSVDAAVTGVAAAIAEHGSLVCESGPARARGSSLIPPVHVAVVSAAQVLPDLCDYFAVLSRRSRMPAAVSLITGPSKTADIEGVLVTGVHGPAVAEIVLVRDP